ncbi:5-formyltetrahydrofolate cyclo-ligase [Candidatus Thiodiazotropha endoloripes]|nr:5-formyltetrahydrofolate cyclo-ligase [Candidatus Thiodiazotropha endoloripes]
MMQTAQLRQQIKAQRRQLSRQTCKQHSLQLLDHAKNYKPFRQSRRIAFYHAVSGEIDPKPLLEEALRSGKTPYLPILRQDASIGLWFAPYTHQAKLKLNRFGIPEPAVVHRKLIKPWSLDMVFVPLVAFDDHGHRMGMGGGFYDRTFAFKLQRSHLTGPTMVGLAHNLQHRPLINTNPWDIPLDSVITESHLYQF